MKKQVELKMSENDIKIAARFTSMLRIQIKKKRACVGCSKVFMSTSAGHRVCHICANTGTRRGKLAESIIIVGAS